MNRQRTILTLAVMLCSITLMAQNTMRVHFKNGTKQDISTSQIDSLTFVNANATTTVETELRGNWLWGNQEAGYYELLAFSNDNTYTGYDYYFSYGFDTMTYGFYSHFGIMLTLWSNGFGYQYRYNWFITGLTENALSVMTKMGSFTYYKLQSEMLRLKVGETLPCGDDEYVFADGIVVRIEGGQLTGIGRGETYILKLTNSSQMIWAYKVIVE